RRRKGCDQDRQQERQCPQNVGQRVMPKRKVKKFTISVVAEEYGVHPQTLRLYEREGLIKPSRSAKGTRYYTEEDVERLELILNLTRDLGVNLAGVEIILNMREKMNHMQREFENFLQYIRDNIAQEIFSTDEHARSALVPRRRIELVVRHGGRLD
ncbi:MAG TPA: helix-turn-helix transcriptional regulator, partial [Blastocatellia bacterium]|nr:helix-turn-helix transcriptional regulator [Blastocatellia bacterium]